MSDSSYTEAEVRAALGKSDFDALTPFQKVADFGAGLLEVPAAMATGTAADVYGGYKGLTSMLTGKGTTRQNLETAVDDIDQAKSLAYQPRTETGKYITGKMGDAFTYANDKLGMLGGYIGGALNGEQGSNVGEEVGKAALPITLAVSSGAGLGKGRVNPPAPLPKQNVFEQPRIDAAKMAVEKYGLSLDPVVSNPSKMNTVRVTAAGQDHLLALLRRHNEPKVAAILKKDLGIPDDIALTSSSVFDDVRDSAAGAKRQIQTMNGFADDGTARANISALQPKALIGAKAASTKVAALIKDANDLLSSPNTLNSSGFISPNIAGARLISEIENLRTNARNIYKSPDLHPVQRIVADTNIGIANELEALIERGLQSKGNTDLLAQFRDGRTKMAKAYTLESATNLNTGIVDPMIIAKMTSKDNALTGTFADIGTIAGNFPESLGVKSGAPGGLKEMIPTRITRTGGGGTAGYVIGSTMGNPLIGAAIGAGAGELFGNMYAKRLATNPSVQRSASIPQDGNSLLSRVAPSITPSYRDIQRFVPLSTAGGAINNQRSTNRDYGMYTEEEIRALVEGNNP